MKVLSVVCARASSKGMKNKCTTKISGKMVVEYAVEYSLSLGDGVKTVVSTDIEKLIDYCKKNAVTCIRRDPRFCTDESKIDEALADTIEKEGRGCRYCSLVYGNIPTRYPAIFHEALRFLGIHTGYDAVISMQNVEKYHPEWMFEYNDTVIPRQKETEFRRQALPQKMIHDGHTLIFKSEEFLNKFKGIISYDRKNLYSMYGNRIKPLLTNEVIIDIDTARDLKLAEAIITDRLKR